MREILFRGKRKDNGKWLYGSLVQHFESVSIIDEYNPFFITEVISETVGQYTGLNDKEGRKIFEGDIVIWGFEIYIITYIEEYGRFLGANREAKYGITPADELEVIGNIYDNPELFEEENEIKFDDFINLQY